MAVKGKNPEFPIRAKDETGEAFKSVQKNFQNLASNAAILEGPLGKVAGRINAVGAAVGRLGPGVVAASVAFTGLGVVIAKGTKEYIEYEQQMFKINALLKVTEGISGQTAESIDEISRSLGRNTLANQGGARSAAAALLKFTNVTNENFERTLELAQDITAVFGGDLQSNVIKIGRALDNPKRGLESLERNLISVNDSWKAYVIDAFEAGDVTEAQSAIMKELARTMGGVGQGEAQGVAGAIDSAGESWTEFSRKLGLPSAVESVFKELTETLDGMSTVIDEVFNPTKVDQLADAMSELVDINNQLNSESTRIGFNIRNRNLKLEKIQTEDLISELEAQILAEKNLAGFRAEGIRGAQVLAKLRKELMKDERDYNTQLLENETTLLRMDKVRVAELKRIKSVAESAWEASLPPLEKLQSAYQKNAENLAEAIKSSSEDSTVETQKLHRGLLLLEEKFQRDKVALATKSTKGTSRADQVREQLLRDEVKIKASFERRARIVLQAIDSLDATQIQKRRELLDTLRLLQDDFEADIRDKRISNAISISNSINSIVDTASEYFFSKSRRISDGVNEEYDLRAKRIRENVKLGVTSVDKGNKQLAALDTSRQSDLDRSAKKQFERGKKLARAVAIANAAALIVGAMADTSGNIYVRLAAGVTAGLAGAAQVAAINATQFEGGGGVSTPIAAPSTAGFGGGQQAPSVTQRLVLIGNENTSFSLSQVEALIGQINDVSGRLDLSVIDPSSRNARDIRDSSSSLVI